MLNFGLRVVWDLYMFENVKHLFGKKEEVSVFYKSWLITCLVWSFMIVQFWWGNHDWLNKVSLTDGLFEGRYSQHLFITFLLEGQIMPIFIGVISLAALVLMGMLAMAYLGGGETCQNCLFPVLLVSLSPYVATVFYYVFIMLPLAMYGALGVAVLFFTEPPYKLWKFGAGFLGFVLLFGSYPPILSFVFVLFVGKKLIGYVQQKVQIKEIFRNVVFFCGQVGSAFAVYHVILGWLRKVGALNTEMYNLQVYSMIDIFKQIGVELVAPITNVSYFYGVLGVWYTVFYTIILGWAIFKFFSLSKNRMMTLILVAGLFLASRLPFLLSSNAYLGEFRVAYWGQSGLLIVAMYWLFSFKVQWVRNLSLIFLFIFIQTDYDIQKIQYFMFKSERLFHNRLLERISLNPNLKAEKAYYTLNIGYPDFRGHFCLGDICARFDNDLLDNTVLPADLGQVLPLGVPDTFTARRLGFWDKRLWRVGSSGFWGEILPEDVDHIRWWMYQEAKLYPAESGLYVDDKFLIMNFDEKKFNKSKELILKDLQE